MAGTKGTLAEVPGRAGEEAERVQRRPDATHLRFDPLANSHMPRDFRVSLETYRRGGTDEFLASAPDHLEQQPMKGFEEQYRNIVDYIVRITHRIWEEKDIGYIYDTYSHDCRVWDDVGLQYGRDKIVADTVHTNNAFPDIRLVADEVIWAGDEEASFHTSHRTMILGTNTGYSRFGAPTGRPVRLLCIANCVSRNNEIYDEHVAYDSAGMLRQLGFDVPEMARRAVADRVDGPFAPNFAAGEPRRMAGQNKPPLHPIPDSADDIRKFVHAAFDTIWNRRNFSAMDRLYAPSVVFEGSTGRVYRGVGQLRSHVPEMARRAVADRVDGPFAPNFAAGEPRRMAGQNKPPLHPIPDSADDIRKFVHAAFDTIWNRRNFSAMDRLYAPSVVFEGSTGRVYRGVGQLRSHVMSMIAMFPNIAVSVEDLYWMGNPRDGYLVSIRWGAVGSHRGNGPYGEPTGRETHIWGITQWLIENGKVQKEWTVFNEFGILMQLLG